MRHLSISYDVWETVIEANPSWALYKVEKGSSYFALTGHQEVIFESFTNDAASFDSAYPSAVLVQTKEDAVALLVGVSLQAPRKDGVGNQVFSPSVRLGNKLQVISQNFCDKHTWYSTSTRRVAQTLTDTGDGLTWALGADTVGVDVNHGRVLHERRLRAAHSPVVRVDSTPMTEKDPHDNAGDFVIDYATMRVTFDSSQAGSAVEIDFSEVNNSKWYLEPVEGKRLYLVGAELQFSVDALMEDTFVFQARADVSKNTYFRPYWDGNTPPGPYPAGTMLPLGDATYYQTVKDLICEANKAYPETRAIAHGSPTWRDSPSQVVIFAWDYSDQAVIEITSESGTANPNDIEISLEHDIEMTGTMAVVTFYCLSEDI